MKRSNHTLRFPRTWTEACGLSPRESYAIECYRPPLTRRAFYFCVRHGWLGILAAIVLGILWRV